jgi:hypothetical protein
MKKLVLFLTILFIAVTTCRADDNPAGISLNMFNANHGNTYLASLIYIDAHNNFTGASFLPVNETDTVTTVPATGWANKIAAEPGTLFIAYLKGDFYRIDVEDYIVHNKEEEKTTGSLFLYTTTVKRSSEILGVRISYQQLTDVKIEPDVSVKSRNPRIFVAYDDNNILINKIKAKLTEHSCTVIPSAPQSDFQLYVKASERKFNSDRDFVYCYVDVTLELFNTSAGETVYAGDFSQKGVSTSRDRAVRAAIDDAVNAIGEKIIPLIIKTP